MLAEIFTAERDWADVMLLIAVILGLIAAFLAWPEKALTSTLGWLSVAFIAFALMLL